MSARHIIKSLISSIIAVIARATFRSFVYSARGKGAFHLVTYRPRVSSSKQPSTETTIAIHNRPARTKLPNIIITTQSTAQSNPNLTGIHAISTIRTLQPNASLASRPDTFRVISNRVLLFGILYSRCDETFTRAMKQKRQSQRRVFCVCLPLFKRSG